MSMSGRESQQPPRHFDVEAMLKEEFEHLAGNRWVKNANDSLAGVFANMHKLPPSERPSALCLSGGGIRSATFCLGVLQSLARSGRLKSFHYLSTVSGGGYIGGWLTNWLRIKQWKWDDVIAQLADGSAQTPRAAAALEPVPKQEAAPPAPSAPHLEGADERDRNPMTRLRAYSNYLSPVWGLSGDSLSLLAIFLRNLLLNWLVWLPLIAAAVALPRLYVGLIASPSNTAFATIVALTVVSALLIVAGIGYVVADLPFKRSEEDEEGKYDEVNSWFAVACFLPVTLAAVIYSIVGAWGATLIDAEGESFRHAPWWWYTLGGAVAHLAGIPFGLFLRGKRKLPKREGGANWFGLAMVLASGGAGGSLLWLALQSTGLHPEPANDQRLLYATISVPAMLGAFWLAMTLYAGLARIITDEDDREWWARATAWWLYASIGWVLAFVVVIYLPLMLLDQFGNRWPTGLQIGVGGGLLGVVTSAIGYWSKNGNNLKRRANGLLKATGLHLLDLMAAAVILAGVLGMSLAWSVLLEGCHARLPTVCKADLRAESEYLRSESLVAGASRGADSVPSPASDQPPVASSRAGEARAYEHVMLNADWRVTGVGIGLFAVLALLASKLIGANTFSLHGMYGNRLVRAYLGTARPRRHPHWFTGFDPEDNCRLAECTSQHPAPDVSTDEKGCTLSLDECTSQPSVPGGPRLFHVVNMAMNLVRPSNQRLAWQQRKASSFIATPLHCGAAIVGFVPTGDYGDPRGMSLGRAMTISGAAASPNMGYHSSALVTFVMTLFNVRLGWWLANPRRESSGSDKQSGPRMGLGFWAMVDEAFGRTTDDRESVYLSDGGHFENLGIYEMVRRRCHRIVVVDASCDLNFQYADLLDAVRKVRVDLGIPIDLPPVLPGPARNTAHPRRIAARIRYSARDGNSPETDGMLILLKPRLTGDEPPDITSYAESSRRDGSVFPHQSTADQFFDESQFESYRLLGLTTAEAALPGVAEDWPAFDPMTAPVPDETAFKHAVPDTSAGVAGAAGTGLAGAVHTFGAGAALATALTVGGTLGVAGSVGLSNSEIRLSAEDRALLKAGLNVRLAAGELQLAEADRALLRNGFRVDGGGADWQGMLRALQISAARLDEAADKLLRMGGNTGPVVLQTIGELRVAISDLSKKLPSPGGAPNAGLEAALQKLVLQVEKLDTRLSSLNAGSAGSTESIGSVLVEIRKALEALQKSIETISPRRNVRGSQEGGAR